MSLEINDKLREKLHESGVFLVTEVNHGVINELTSWILRNRPERKEFTILIASSGGSPSAVIRFASFLLTLDPEVRLRGVAFDTCGSAALTLLQCCHSRAAVRHTAFFIHHLQSKVEPSGQEPDKKQLELELDSARKLEEELVKFQCTRTGMTRDEWMKLADEGENDVDTPIFAEKALELGLIDETVGSFPVF